LHGRVVDRRPVVEMAPAYMLASVVNGRAPDPAPGRERACPRSLDARDGKVATVTPYLGAGAVTFVLSGDNCDSDCTRQIVHPRAEVVEIVRDATHRGRRGLHGAHAAVLQSRLLRGPNPSHSHGRITHVRTLCFSDGAHPRWTSLFALEGG